jgi:hypothetical protein
VVKSSPPDRRFNATSGLAGTRRCEYHLTGFSIVATNERSSEPEVLACDAICCSKFDEPIQGSHNLSKHNGSIHHQAAKERGKYFDNIRETIEEVLQLRILSFRNLVCDATNCEHFQRQWSLPRAFMQHLASEEHVRYDKAFEEEMTSGSTRLANREKRNGIFQCHREKCDEFRQRFKTNLDYREHCATDSHIQASPVVVPRLQTPDPVSYILFPNEWSCYERTFDLHI